MANAIEVVNLTKKYGKDLAVDHINFEVGKDEIFGFLGPNGAGKTTTIRILTGLTKASEGYAKIFGHELGKEMILAKSYMGIVPEDSNVYVDLSAWDNIIFTGELYSIKKAEREARAKELLEILGLYDRRDSKVKDFSKGMKRRLTFAMALINEPRLLFLDEPTSGLDVQSSQLIKRIVREQNSNGVTVFITTHNIEEANVMCDRVAIINKGRIAAIDRPENLKRAIQSVQSVEVAFDKAPSTVIKDLEAIQSVTEVRKEGDKYRLYTADPAGALSGTWDYARGQNLKIVSLNTLGPSLEDVFVKITSIAEDRGDMKHES